MRTIEGKLIAAGLKFALVVSRFNSFITERLLEGALDCLRRQGVAEERPDRGAGARGLGDSAGGQTPGPGRGL